VSLIQPTSAEATRINEATGAWRQGDAALEERWFVHVCDPRFPLTAQAEQAQNEIVTAEVQGLVVTTQTCDISRLCTEREFVEVSPLVEVDAQTLGSVERGDFPRFAYLPGVAARSLVVHLERTMTVEKACLATWARTPGVLSDDQARVFANALARKRQRFAFPDEFTAFVERLRRRILDKHDRNSPQGQALRALEEIRVSAAPSWSAASVSLMFWFIRRDGEAAPEGKNWAGLCAEWLELVPASEPYTTVYGQVTTLAVMSAADYRYSDRLDLDHLSSRSVRGRP
jgi:hypothetical protein